MDTTDLTPAVTTLSTHIDTLEASLGPLLTTPLSTTTSKLPLLDKAKLYVLTSYAIETILFSSLRLNGIDAKSHALFQELTRVRHYFDKIKQAETGPAKRTQTLDKGAAGRFIRHGLAGNERLDQERREREERERNAGKRKFEDMTESVGSHSRFSAMSKKMRADEEAGLVRKLDGSSAEEGEGGSAEDSVSGSKRGQRATAEEMNEFRGLKSTGTRTVFADEEPASSDAGTSAAQAHPKQKKKKKSAKVPKGPSEAFQALLNGPLAKETDSESSKKTKSKKRKSG